MGFESYFAATYVRAARMVDSLLGTASPGIVLSVDIGDSFLDFVASGAAAFGSHALVKAPSLRRYRSLVWDYRRPLKPADVVAEPPLFGRVDGVTRFLDDDGESKRYVLGCAEITTRRIDSWLKGRSPLRLLHLGDSAMLIDQLHGASEALARDRPLVTLYPGFQDASVLSKAISELGYQAFDLQSDLRLAQTGSPDLNFAWLLIPREMNKDSLLELSPASDVAMDISTSSFGWNAMDRSATPRQRRSSDLFHLTATPLPDLSRSLGMAQIASSNDCYPLESDGTSSWRWLGPRPRARLAVPCPFPGTYRFEVAVLSTRVPDGLGSCRVLVEGREVPTTAHGNDRGKIEFVGHLNAAGYRGYVELDLINPGSPAPAGSDPRTLRMSVGAVSMAPYQ